MQSNTAAGGVTNSKLVVRVDEHLEAVSGKRRRPVGAPDAQVQVEGRDLVLELREATAVPSDRGGVDASLPLDGSEPRSECSHLSPEIRGAARARRVIRAGDVQGHSPKRERGGGSDQCDDERDVSHGPRAYDLVAALRNRIVAASAGYTFADNVSREEFVDGIVVVCAAAKGLQVPPRTLGLTARCWRCNGLLDDGDLADGYCPRCGAAQDADELDTERAAS